MFQFLKTMLTGRNEFASGGLLLMIIGGLSVWLRAVPERLWYWLVGQITMTITVKDDDAAFVWVKEWFLEQKFLKRIRRVDLDTTLRSERIAMIPAPGKHWFWLGARPFEVWFSRTDNTHERSGRRIESFTFRTIGRDRSALQHFVDDVVQSHIRREGVQSYLYTYNDGWDYVEGYSSRVLESVLLEAGEKEYLLRDVSRFRGSRRRYELLGIPYHRGYLLYGPPGTGKTHTIHYLANQLPDHTTLLITAEQVAFLDHYFQLARFLQPAMIVIEDVDLIARSRQDMYGPCDESILNKLLNEMDGLCEDAAILFVLTTNRPENLESALASRPGRIDQAIEFPLPDAKCRAQLVRLYACGLPLDDELVQVIVRKTENASAAFIKELMRRAAQSDLQNGSSKLSVDQLNTALEEMLFLGGSLNAKLLGASALGSSS